MAQNDTQNNENTKTPWSERLRKNTYYPILYMFIITFFFTLILVGIAAVTKDKVEANRQIMFERAVLMATLPDVVTAETPSGKVHDLYVQYVQEADGEFFRIQEDGALKAYAVPMAGQGFWDEIRGIVGFNPDKTTLSGVSFYQQNETPGLGAEILKPYFREQFEGLEVKLDAEQPVDVVPMGTELQANEVYAVTGATQTSVRVEKIINDAIKDWQDTPDSAEEESQDKGTVE